MSVPDFLVWHCAGCGAAADGKKKPCNCATNVGVRYGPNGMREETWWDDERVPEDWQPISTAPKSTSEPCAGGHQVRGVYFLAYCPDESVTDPQGCMCVCWWEPHMHGVGKGGWQGEGDYELRPTHWMPLPSRGPDSAEDDDSVQCDACGEMVPRDDIAKVTAYGIETSACAKCRGDE